jgi:hypothetical protein
MPRRTIYHAPLIHSIDQTTLQYQTQTLLCVSPGGIIEWIEQDVPPSRIQEVASKYGVLLGDGGEDVEIVEFGEGEFLVNGMIDTHTVRCVICSLPIS